MIVFKGVMPQLSSSNGIPTEYLLLLNNGQTIRATVKRLDHTVDGTTGWLDALTGRSVNGSQVLSYQKYDGLAVTTQVVGLMPTYCRNRVTDGKILCGIRSKFNFHRR